MAAPDDRPAAAGPTWLGNVLGLVRSSGTPMLRPRGLDAPCRAPDLTPLGNVLGLFFGNLVSSACSAQEFRFMKRISSRRSCRPMGEQLESRALLTTFHVINNNEYGPGSLRAAIL